MTFAAVQVVAHLRSVRPKRRPRKARHGGTPARTKALCGKWVPDGHVVRMDREPETLARLCPTCISEANRREIVDQLRDKS